MQKVKFYDCYDFSDELILIEMAVDESSDGIDLGEFAVPENGANSDDWQAPYMEQYLNSGGTEKICELYFEPEPPVKPCRFAFFIFKTQEQKGYIDTPYGQFPIDELKPVPRRLSDCIEFEEED